MARQRGSRAGGEGPAPSGFLGRILGAIGRRFGGGRGRRRTCWQWMYGCTWEDASGQHVYFKAHAVVTDSPTNYQQASAQARREVLASLTDSERALTAHHPGATFRCRRIGRVIEVPGPC